MFNVRLMKTFQAVPLDQFDNAAKTGQHIERQRFKFIPNPIVEKFYGPCHEFLLLHFCNVNQACLLGLRNCPHKRPI